MVVVEVFHNGVGFIYLIFVRLNVDHWKYLFIFLLLIIFYKIIDVRFETLNIYYNILYHIVKTKKKNNRKC